MVGLRTQESEKFNRFWALVQEEAEKKNSVFFGDCGEERDFETSELEGEDFSGWLIPKEMADTFENDFLSNKISDEWSDHIVFAIWDKTGEKISIEFKQF